MRFEGLTFFVTGVAGFIGSALVRHLLSDTAAFVVNIDKLTYASNLDSIPQAAGHPRYAFARADICDGPALRALFDRYKPDAVMNLAAIRRAVVSLAVHCLRHCKDKRQASMSGFYDFMSAQGNTKAFNLVTVSKPAWLPNS